MIMFKRIPVSSASSATFDAPDIYETLPRWKLQGMGKAVIFTELPEVPDCGYVTDSDRAGDSSLETARRRHICGTTSLGLLLS